MKYGLKKSFTLTETLIVVVILGFIAAAMLASLKKGNYKAEALKKAGTNYYHQINIASKQILVKYSYGYKMTALKTIGGTEFSISDSNSDASLAPLFKKMLGSGTYSAPSNYSGSYLINESGTKVGPNGGYKVSNFTQGFKTKNGTYMAFMLHEDCTTSETDNIYDPSTPETHSATKSCGLIFYDVNADDSPNTLGIDQYIVSIHKLGLD